MVFAAVRMDATFRRPSRRVLPCVALLALVCLTFLFLSCQDSGHHSFVLHHRRDSLQARQGPFTSILRPGSVLPAVISATTSTGSSVGPTGSSSTESLSSTISTLVSSPISVSQSRDESTSSRSSTSLPPSTTLSSARSTIAPSVPATTDKTVSSIPIDRPATTLSITNNFIPTLAQTSSEPSASQTNTSTVDAASSHAGFWQNKGAVAATFVIVSLVFAAFGAVAIVFYLKKRSNRYQERLHDELFDKYTEPEFRSNSPGLSINNSPMDAFASRDTGSDHSPPLQLYGISDTQRAFHSTSPVQHPDYYNTQSTPARYLAPSQALVSKGAAPPSSLSQPNKRDSYQRSIDSFYGASPSGRRV